MSNENNPKKLEVIEYLGMLQEANPGMTDDEAVWDAAFVYLKSGELFRLWWRSLTWSVVCLLKRWPRHVTKLP